MLFTLLALVQLYFLYMGQYEAFVGLFVLGAMGRAAFGKGSAVLAACVTSCELDDIGTNEDCNLRSGMKVAYWAKYSEIDWTAQLLALNFSSANQEILNWVMLSSAVFKKLEFNRKTSTYSATYTSDAGTYATLATFVFDGKSRAARNAFAKAVACCKIILHIFDNNCTERVMGVDYDGNSFSPQVTALRITRHLDTGGVLGGDLARDEIDLGGEALYPPLFASVTEAEMPV